VQLGVLPHRWPDPVRFDWIAFAATRRDPGDGPADPTGSGSG
jgi:hypothetical protein